MRDKKISITIPVYNGAKHLSACLDSVFVQDCEIHEVIIIDDNSTDRTAEIIQSYQSTHSNLVYVIETRRTRGAARNAGLRAVTGDIVVMTDVDCVVPTDWARKLSEPIIRGKELVTTGYQYNLLPKNYWAQETQRKCDYFLERQPAPAGYISFTDTKNLAVRADLLKDVGFDDRFYSLEDVDLEIRLKELAQFRFLPDVKVGHAHASSLLAVWRMGYERAYWYAQLYHKFCGVRDSQGSLIFSKVPLWMFYKSLLSVNISVIKSQGIQHLLFFIVFDLSWKVGSAMGFVRKNREFYP